MTARTKQAGSGSRVFWTFRILETGLLLTALVGLVLFAFSIVDIVRIETKVVAASPVASVEATAGTVAAPPQELPAGAWPGVFVFFGSLLLLQPVRAVLMRYRRDDGSERDDAITAAAAATAEALASLPSEPGPAAEAALEQTEG